MLIFMCHGPSTPLPTICKLPYEKERKGRFFEKTYKRCVSVGKTQNGVLESDQLEMDMIFLGIPCRDTSFLGENGNTVTMAEAVTSHICDRRGDSNAFK